MVQQMLAIWSLVPLPFLKPAWTSGKSRFMYCWSLAWRILSITLLECAAAAAKSLRSCPTLCDPMDCSLPGSSIHGIFQARILEWVAIAFSGNSSWLISNPKRWCCESVAVNIPANMENSAVATRLEKVSFHPNLKERQCQRMFKLPHNCTHLTHYQSNAQNSPSQASAVREPELPDVQAGFRKGRGTRDQIANICWTIRKAKEFQKNIYFCFIDYAKAFDCVDHSKLWKILKEMGIPDHLICLLRNLHTGQEETVRTGHGKQTGSK